jgi:hypothetical protein
MMILTPQDDQVVTNWIRADRQLQDFYGRTLANEPTRIVVVVDGWPEVLELTKEFTEGRARVFARRLPVQGIVDESRPKAA